MDRNLGASSLVSPRVPEAPLSRRPATLPETKGAWGHLVAQPAARSPRAGSSATATDRAAAVPGRLGGARSDTAGTDPADTPRRPSRAHRTARSTGAPPGRCEPADTCPAPVAPSPVRASPLGPVTARNGGSEFARRLIAAVSPVRRPYREGRQPGSPGVEREPDAIPGATVRQRDEIRPVRCSQQLMADSTRPRHGEALRPKRAGGLTAYARDHSYSRSRSSILRLAISCRPSMHLA